MKVVGIDSATKNFGITEVVNGDNKRAALWNPSSTKLSHAERLMECRRWLRFKLKLWKPDMVAVLELAVFHNKKVVRIMSHFEAAAIITAKECVSSVVSITDTEARGIVFDRGNISKDDAWEIVKKEWSFDFGRKDSGGTDKMDAAVAALAAPSFIERG